MLPPFAGTAVHGFASPLSLRLRVLPLEPSELGVPAELRRACLLREERPTEMSDSIEPLELYSPGQDPDDDLPPGGDEAVDRLTGVPGPLADAMRRRGFENLTSVQRAVLDAEFEGHDLRITSQTGSGKTVAIGALAGTKLSVTVSRGKSSSVQPRLELADPDATLQTDGGEGDTLLVPFDAPFQRHRALK